MAILFSTAAFAAIGSSAEDRAAAYDREQVQESYEAVQKGATATTMQITQSEEPEETQETPEAESTYESMIGSRDWGAEDAEMLLRIAMAEAEGEGTKGKALVMLVVLNRVWSDEFPDTVEEVIFQKNQFSVTMPGGRYYTTEPDEECMEALHLVNTGWDESYGALYFESCEGDSWHSRNLEFLFQAGNHKFYR